MSNLFSLDITDYSLFRANECANDLMDRLIEGADFDTLLKIRTESDALMAKFAALSQSAQQRAVALSQTQALTR